MAENKILCPASISSSDGSVSEDSWTFIDELDDLHEENHNDENETAPLSQAKIRNETPPEDKVEVVAIDERAALDAVTHRHADAVAGVASQRYGPWYIRIGCIG